MAKFSIGTLLNRPKDAQGLVGTEARGFLPKTLAKLVFMSDGKSVEAEVNHLNARLDNMGVATTEYDSMEAYQNALDDQAADPDAIYVVNI